jgi:hypothetical protein
MFRRDLTCPKCKGKKFQETYLACSPSKIEITCENCLFDLRFFERQNACLKITQYELDTKFANCKLD